jgi:hypothetical protein
MSELTEILATVREIRAWQTEHGALLVDRADEHHKALFGNGQPGIAERLLAVEANCRNASCRGLAWWQQLLVGVAEYVIAGAILAYAGWQLGLFRGR